jgi:MFS family permease
LSVNIIINKNFVLGGKKAWLIWFLAAISFGYAFLHRVAPGVMVHDLMRDFAISGTMLGTLSALYFYPYFLLQIPLGALLDVLGARYLLSFALFLAAFGSILFGSANNIEMAYIGRFLIGVGCSVGFLSALTLTSKWFPKNRFALISGLTMLIAMMGAILGQAPLAMFISNFGWRSSMWVLSTVGIILSLLVLMIVRNGPEKNSKPQITTNPWTEMLKSLRKVSKSFEMWKIALVAATMSGPMLTLGGLWGTPYLMSAYNLGRSDAAFLTSFLLFGWAFAAPCFGWFSDFLGRRKPILIGGSAVLSLTLGLMILIPSINLYLTLLLFTLIGASGSVMVSAFALVKEVISKEAQGSAIGIVNSMTVASGAILQPFVGLILDLRWDGLMSNGARIFNETDYRLAFIIIFLSSIVGFLVSITLKEQPTI